MDGRATASPHPTETSDVAMQPQQEPDKISAYYSLVFPNFTYYLQTLSVTIGRRCIPTATGSSNDLGQVDVDLGPLKSVSRLHAKIEYEEEEERFVLVVIGRNGAWVDSIWSPSGTRVPLSERSRIQIASRTFEFVLPPHPAPEDSPSPSSHSSVNRPRSPSVDITSISPPSSMPSRSPPPAILPRTVPDIPPLTIPHIPTSSNTSKPRANYKKRKKPNPEPLPHPKPEDIPPRPPFTYAQLCHRAIKAIGGKATLQEICRWISESFDWYRYNDAGWQSSVRHNLSSNRAFKKLERCVDGRGKGFLWSVDEKFEYMFEEQESKNHAGKLPDGTVAKERKASKKKDKATASLLGPPLKRSVKGDSTGALLPPPLTYTPLKYPTSILIPPQPSLPGPTPSAPVQSQSSPPLLDPASDTRAPGSEPVTLAVPSGESNGFAQSTPSIPAIPPSLFIPIVVGPIPTSHPSSSSQATNPTGPLTSTPIVLHDGKLILNPDVFSHLTQEQVKELEALGAQKALQILQSYIARFLKEQRLKKRESARGRGRGRGQAIRGRGRKGEDATAPGAAEHSDNNAPADTKAAPPTTSPFTKTPLPSRYPQPVHDLGNSSGSADPAPKPALSLAVAHSLGVEDAEPIIVVDDSDTFQPPAAKKRRLEVDAAFAVVPGTT